MTGPLLFLDVDGVLNAIPARTGLPRRFADQYERTEIALDGEVFPIHYRLDVVARLNNLVQEGSSCQSG